MLMLKPGCECCDKDLPPHATDAMICTFECTFCADCVATRLNGRLPELRRQFCPAPDPAGGDAGEIPGSDCSARISRRDADGRRNIPRCDFQQLEFP